MHFISTTYVFLAVLSPIASLASALPSSSIISANSTTLPSSIPSTIASPASVLSSSSPGAPNPTGSLLSTVLPNPIATSNPTLPSDSLTSSNSTAPETTSVTFSPIPTPTGTFNSTASLNPTASFSSIEPPSPTASANSSTSHHHHQSSLADWFVSAVYSVYPNTTSWQANYPKVFAPNVTATINQAIFNYTTFLAAYTQVEADVEQRFSQLEINFNDVVAVPNANDQGGLVVVTGTECGILRAGGTAHGHNGALAVVSDISGTRMISEWREVSDLPL